PGSSSALPPTATATAAPFAGDSSMPTATPGPSASSGEPSGSSIWNSFMADRNPTTGRPEPGHRPIEHRSYVEGFAAAAAPLLVGIAEGEARLDLVLDIVHLGADDEHRRLGIDQQGDPLVLHDLVEFAFLISIFEGVCEARAAAAAHADADADRRLAALGEQRLDAPRRGLRHHHRLPQRHGRLAPETHPLDSIARPRRATDLPFMWGRPPPLSPSRRRPRAGPPRPAPRPQNRLRNQWCSAQGRCATWRPPDRPARRARAAHRRARSRPRCRPSRSTGRGRGRPRSAPAPARPESSD